MPARTIPAKNVMARATVEAVKADLVDAVLL